MPARQLTAEELHTWVSLLTMWRRLTSGMERQLAEAGSSGADYQVLVTLSESTGGRSRPRDIGRWLGWERSRVSHQLRRMEQRGLVRRSGVEDDARGTTVELTAEGRRVLRAAAPGHVAWVREHVLSQMTPAEAATLAAVAERIAGRLEPE